MVGVLFFVCLLFLFFLIYYYLFEEDLSFLWVVFGKFASKNGLFSDLFECKKAVELSTAFLYSIDFQLITDLKSINTPPR